MAKRELVVRMWVEDVDTGEHVGDGYELPVKYAPMREGRTWAHDALDRLIDVEAKK